MNNENIDKMRHSASHILASAVNKLYPDTKFAIGPSIENGFYYDFELPTTITSEDLLKIEKEMSKIIKQNLEVENLGPWPQIKARQWAKEYDQPYKMELIDELEKLPTFYKIGDFTDLCAGPHVAKTGEVKAFKLLSIAGAYWRGDEKKQMLTRIYGTAFETQDELDEYLKLLKEAKSRDHKKFGHDLDLFSFHSEAPGCPFWHEKGMILWNTLEQFGKLIRKKYGYIEIKTPSIAKNSLWITSGHWDHYKDNMFIFDVDKETYCIKPMDCPFNIKIYQTRPRSYRELPIRYTEIGRTYRKEKSGELNGLLRVQEVTQDDSHIFAREDQVKDEITILLKMVDEFYSKLGLKPDFFLSTRPDDFMGEKKTWDKAEQDLKEALTENKIDYNLKEKDGAFYGPKIDVDAKDALGRTWQVATIQLDFQLPGRFKCEYIDEKGNIQTPVLIHAAIFGAFERMIGILLEHYAGALPLWLAPIQVQILPVSDKAFDYACKVYTKIQEAGIRVEVDMSNETLGKKIRNAELQKSPYILILGQKEIEKSEAVILSDPAKTGKSKDLYVSVRSHSEGDQGQQKLAELIEKFKNEH